MVVENHYQVSLLNPTHAGKFSNAVNDAARTCRRGRRQIGTQACRTMRNAYAIASQPLLRISECWTRDNQVLHFRVILSGAMAKLFDMHCRNNSRLKGDSRFKYGAPLNFKRWREGNDHVLRPP